MAVPGSSTGPVAGQAGRDAVGSSQLWVEGSLWSPAGWQHLQHPAVCRCKPCLSSLHGQRPSGQEESCALPSWQAERCPSALIPA